MFEFMETSWPLLGPSAAQMKVRRVMHGLLCSLFNALLAHLPLPQKVHASVSSPTLLEHRTVTGNEALLTGTQVFQMLQ